MYWCRLHHAPWIWSASSSPDFVCDIHRSSIIFSSHLLCSELSELTKGWNSFLKCAKGPHFLTGDEAHLQMLGEGLGCVLQHFQVGNLASFDGLLFNDPVLYLGWRSCACPTTIIQVTYVWDGGQVLLCQFSLYPSPGYWARALRYGASCQLGPYLRGTTGSF